MISESTTLFWKGFWRKDTSRTQDVSARNMSPTFSAEKTFHMSMLAVICFGLTCALVPSSASANDSLTYRGHDISFYQSMAQNPAKRAEAIRGLGNFGPQAATAVAPLEDALRD